MRNNIKNEEIIFYFNEGKKISEIASIFNCNPETIRLRLKKEQVNTSKNKCDVRCVHCDGDTRKEGKTNSGKQRYSCLNCNKLFSEDFNIWNDNLIKKHEEIKNMYLIENMSTTEIGNKLGVSSTVPQRILKKYGLTRDVSTSHDVKNANRLNLTYDEYIKKLPAFFKYKKQVNRITKKQNIRSLPNFDKRGLCGVKNAYQLDHKYSILEGFKNGVDVEIIGDIANLEFIPWEDNLKKGSNCSITLKQLFFDIQVRVK